MRGYTDEQLDWLRENVPRRSWVDTAEQYNRLFTPSKTLLALKTTCNRHGIYAVGALGEKHSWNDSLGAKEPRMSDGRRRIRDGGTYKLKSRLVYEQAYGAIPPGLCVWHIDGNTSNDAPENLTLVSRRALRYKGLLSRWNCGFRSPDPELRLTAIIWCEHHYAIKTKTAI